MKLSNEGRLENEKARLTHHERIPSPPRTVAGIERSRCPTAAATLAAARESSIEPPERPTRPA